MVVGRAAATPVGTWSVLFTDQVGSTAMRVAMGEDAFDGVRADLDGCLGAALTAHGAVVTKSTGDGVMAGFTSTAAALRCSVAIQQAVATRNRAAGEPVGGREALAVRIGISVGDAVVDNGDLQGTAVVEAARLCAATDSGTILCSGAVRAVSANRSGCTFGPASPLDLKGLPAPVVTHEVDWEPLPYEPDVNRLAFRVLGPLEVHDGDRVVAVGGPKECLVLAVLLARVNSPVSVDALIDAVWGDRPPRTAERTVHSYVARLRRTLEPGRPHGESSTLLVTVGHTYELRLTPGHLDAMRFEELASRGANGLEPGGDSMLREALGLWRGDAFAEFREVEACAAAARRLEELRLAAVEDRVAADLAAGQSAELIGELEALLREEPYRERLWGHLILALYRAGRQRDALEAYQRARRLLTDELGIEPGPDLRRLEAAVLAQDPSLDVLSPAPVSVPGALPGALMEVGPAFVGREAELAWLGDAWAEAVDGRGGFVSVLGPEGIGKTRLAAELARKVHGDGAAVLYGRCDHAHRGARALLGQALQSASTSLAHVVGAADETVDIAEAVARFLPTWSQSRPVLVVLDDLQLADAETLEVVADLAGWCRATPMLVIGVFRTDPGPATRSDDTPGGAASQLALGPMSNDAVGEICDLYSTEPWPAPDLERICELTGGVPLLVHEQASEWARERASRRMADAGGRLAATRRRLVASRGEIADGVEGIQRLLEQRRAHLAGREAQLDASRIAALGGCPYKGLARFEQADASNFFGRERLVAELIARLAESSFLAIVGPSGSGKSSLVRAGLLPVLIAGMLPGGDRCHATILCPGRHPGRELAHALRDGPSAGERRVVFVDQFEETFSAGADHQEQDAFIRRLTELADREDTAVVLAIRADHLGHAATFPALADRLAGSDILVGPMREGELRRTVALPAQRAGLDIEPGLVEVIVGDVAGRAGALPLLSTALAETWERRDARTLTLAGYRAAGGVNGALARMAEDAYATLPPGPRDAARRLMIRLCDAGDDGDLSLRRRLPVSEAAHEGDADAHTALESLANRRLLTIDSDAVEVAHEALLREWPRLRTWLDEDVEGRRLHRRLDDAAHSWETAGRDPSELYRGARLDAAHDWATLHEDELTPMERAFLDASRGARDAERRREAVRVRRLRALLGAVAVALVVSLAAGALAVGQRDRASDRGRLAEARELAAAANANLDVDPERSVLLALAAVERSRSDDGPGGSALPEAEEALHSAVTRSRTVLRVPGLGGSVDWSPQGDTFVTEGPEDSGEIDIRDATTGESVRRFPGHDPDVNEVAYSPDGELLLTTGDDGAARLWDPATGEQVNAIERGGPGPVWGPSFSADGRLFAAAWLFEGVIRVAEVSTGRVVREISGVSEPTAASLSPDGARIAVSSMFSPGPAKVFDVATGAEVFELTRLGETLNVAWSPDGASIAASGGGGAAVWDAATGSRRFALHGHTEAVVDLDWSPDSNVLATAGRDGMAKVWILLDGGAVQAFSLTAHDMRSGVWGVAFSPDGSRLLTGDGGVTNARVWDLAVTAGAEVATLPAPAYAPGGAAFLGEGQLVAAASAGNTVTLWDTERPYVVRTLGGDLPADAANPRRMLVGLRSGPVVVKVAADPSGESVAALREVPGSAASEVVAWDPDTGDELFRHEIEGYAFDLAWSPDGARLAVSDEIRPGDRGHVTVFGRTGDVVGEVWDAQDVGIGNIVFTPDGEQIVGERYPVSDSDVEHAVHTWEWRTGEVVDRLATPGTRGVSLSDDGALAASVLDGERIAILDVARGRDVTVLTGQTGYTNAVDFSADGATVAVGGSDGSVRLWDARDGRELVTLQGHNGAVEALDFRMDGSQLVSAGSDGYVRVWALRLDELEDIARDSLTRGLTTDECQRYLHVDRCPSD